LRKSSHGIRVDNDGPSDALNLTITDTLTVTGPGADKLTITGEATWAVDQFGGIVTKGIPANANAFGLATYAAYALTDTVTLNGRPAVILGEPL
jgi:hypothetical protein